MKRHSTAMMLLASLLSAVLLVLSFPISFGSPSFPPPMVSAVTIWFAYVPISFVLRNQTPRTSFLFGYLFGFVSNSGIFFWVMIALQKYGNLSLPTSLSVLSLMIAVLALYPALTYWASAVLANRAPYWLVASVLFSILEWSRAYTPLGGFPWATPCYSLYGALRLIQGLDILGIVGFNLWIFLCNFLVAECIARIQLKKALPRLALGSLATTFVVFEVYGAWALQKWTFFQQDSRSMPVALLQGNIAQDVKWNQPHRVSILETYQRLTLQSLASRPLLIVWPEAATPSAFPREARHVMPVAGYLGEADLVIGAPTYHHVKGKLRYQNSAFVVDPQGNVKIRYDKQHLVPFGEYVPLSEILPMQAIVPPVAGNFLPGKPSALPNLQGHLYGILICYEILFSDLSIDLVRRGAQFLVTITNDAWFDYTSGPFQHVRFARFRAIETRRPVVRAANTGISTWFDLSGTRHDTLPLFQEGFIIANVAPGQERTFYVAYPYLICCLQILLLGLCVSGVFRKRHGSLDTIS